MVTHVRCVGRGSSVFVTLSSMALSEQGKRLFLVTGITSGDDIRRVAWSYFQVRTSTYDLET